MVATLLLVVGVLASAPIGVECESRPDALPQVKYRDSTALGVPDSGSLENGVRLPREGRGFFTWDPVLLEKPNRAWRRWATDDTIRTTLEIVREYRRDHPRAARLGIGDLSLREGGPFGEDVSPGYTHDSHQNGLDVDVYYPLRSGKERAPRSVDEVDVRLAQDLVDRFVAAGAVLVFVGPKLPLEGKPGVVEPLEDHNDHLHARFDP